MIINRRQKAVKMLIAKALLFQQIEDHSGLASITALDVNTNFRDNSLKFQFIIGRIINVFTDAVFLCLKKDRGGLRQHKT